MYYDHFEKRKPTGIGMIINSYVNHVIAKQILYSYSRGTIKILEIGVGRGAFAEVFIEEAKSAGKEVKYYCIEPNFALYESARSKGINAYNIKIPPFPSDEDFSGFDCVFMSHVLEHFKDYEEVIAVLNGIKNILNNNGRFVFFYPDYLDYGSDFFCVDYSHEYVLTQRRIKMLFVDAGLMITDARALRGCFQRPWSWMVYPIHLLLKLFGGILYEITDKEIFFMIKITFGRNRLVVSEIKKSQS